MPDSSGGIGEPRRRSGRARIVAGLSPILFLLCAGLGCWDRDFRFESTAVYRAPLNGLVLEGEADGLVLSGRDLSSEYRGRFRLRPDDGSAAGIEIRLASKLPRECYVVERRVRLRWTSSSAADSLRKALEQAGVEVPAPKELEEVARVMDGLVLGPKATTMDGQTDVLEVVEVRLDYPIR